MTRWYEVEGIPVGNGVRGQVAGEVLESFEGDVLVGWPSIWHIPLETGFNEARGERSIVPVQNQIYRSESAKSLALVIQDIGWDYSDPEGVEGGRGVEVAPGIGSQVVVVEAEFV